MSGRSHNVASFKTGMTKCTDGRRSDAAIGVDA